MHKDLSVQEALKVIVECEQHVMIGEFILRLLLSCFIGLSVHRVFNIA